MQGINEIQAVGGYLGGWFRIGRILDYIARRSCCKRDVYITVQLTGRPTIRVVSHL